MAADVFENYCRNKNIHVDKLLSSAFSKSGVSGELSLTGLTFSPSSCEALCYTISRSENIMKIDLSNCLLPPSDLCIVLDGVTRSKICELNLKGNNIFGTVTIKLSQMLSRNSSLKRLILEWNTIGTPLNAFSQFCNGLMSNATLDYLDLRNNSLNSECGVEIVDVIAKNTQLKEIDLRWNCLGVKGGEALLKALHSNKTLQSLKVEGNSIPFDMMLTIDEIVKSNFTVQSVKEEYAARQELLTKHILSINQIRVDEFKSLCEKSTQQLQPALNKIKEYAEEKKYLVEQLEEMKLFVSKREEELDTLNYQLEQTKSKLNKSEALNTEKVVEINTLKEMFEAEKLEIKNKYCEQEMKLKNEIKKIESILETEKLSRDNVELSLIDSKNEVDSLLKEVENMKKKLLHITSMHNKVLQEEQTSHQETIDKLLVELKQQQTKSRISIEAIQDETSDRISQLENKIKDLEVSKAEMSANFIAEKTKWIEEKSLIVAEAAEKQAAKISNLNDALEKSNEEYKKLEKELNSAETATKREQKEVTSLKSEQSELKSKLSHLQEKLSEERETVQNLKAELCESKCSKNVVEQECVKHKHELEMAQLQMKELRQRNDSLAADYKREIEQLNSKLDAKVNEITAIRAEELERTRTLCAAIHKYIGGS